MAIDDALVARYRAAREDPDDQPHELQNATYPFFGERLEGLEADRQRICRPSTAKIASQREQSTATSRAPQIACMRTSASRPSRLTNTAIETLSTESRLTADRRGIGSSPGSRTTSLSSPRMVVVHGATNTRRSRGIATSRDSTTTGRRPISANSHHQTSPRAGRVLTKRRPLAATTQGRPTRPARRAGARRTRHMPRRSRRLDDKPSMH